jgi:alkanesulfonate monooxygenase SsuD/methylene tetrahydromethanopterin reductase-like flavin-dependent oxidoreductase (luciferase family)
MTEHYFTGESVYNDALLFASALTQRTTQARIGLAVIQMPFHHPIRLAVQLALLDKDRWKLYEAGLLEGGHDDRARERLLAQAALWRNVYVADSDAQAEDELSTLLLRTRAHMMHVRHAYNPADFHIDPVMLNSWTDPAVGGSEALAFVLATGSLFGSPSRVKEQVAELRETGVQHLLCQTGFGDMSHKQHLLSMRRFGEQVMPMFSG